MKTTASTLLTVHDMALAIGVHPATIRRNVKLRRLPQPIEVCGGQWRFTQADLKKVLSRRRTD